MKKISIFILFSIALGCSSPQDNNAATQKQNDSLRKVLDSINSKKAEVKSSESEADINKQMDGGEVDNTETSDSDSILFNGKIKLLEIQTGYVHKGKFLPTVHAKFKNISDEDIKDYVGLNVIFIDSKREEQIGSIQRHLSGWTNKFFVAGTKSNIEFDNTSGWNSITDQEVIAKLYFDDVLIRTVKVENVELE